MKRILIIEDDSITASLYRNRLQKENFEVSVAADGQAGFFAVHEQKPDAVLLDLMLPKMDGVTILRKLRAQKQFAKLPVFVFSNAYMTELMNEAMAAGASKAFNKSDPESAIKIVEAIKITLYPFGQMEVPPGAPPPPPRPGSPISFPPEVPPVAPIAPSMALKEGPAAASIQPRPGWRPSMPGSMPTIGIPAARPPSTPIPGLNQTGSWPPATAAPTPSATPSRPAAGPAPAPISQAPTASAETENDEEKEFQAELQKVFFEGGPEAMSLLRRNLQGLSKATGGESGAAHLNELFRKVHALSSNCGLAGMPQVASFTACCEAFLGELIAKPENINSSTLRTIANSVDLMGQIYDAGQHVESMLAGQANVLVVDDEMISRMAVVRGLSKAKLQSTALDSPTAALNAVKEKTFELIVLDVSMPEMDGFELCSKIRAIPEYKTTPVVFVTGMTDFKSRAKSILSGGNEFIGKPFLFLELAVKATSFILQGRLGRRKTQAQPAHPPVQAQVVNA